MKRVRFILSVFSLALVCGSALAVTAAEKPANAPARAFSSVTPAILSCMQDKSHRKYGTTYTSTANNSNAGISETHYYGLTRLAYALDPATATITYTILQKPSLASNDQVWNGIHASIKACS